MAKTVLIVDDSESIREVVNFTLQNEGYDVLVGI
ncbi:MAG TPA: two-component system response regulator, partial [Marinilabiliaceae bacterium]|nr:two-component system response regulator [Marinilabiliaceae bacterium]